MPYKTPKLSIAEHVALGQKVKQVNNLYLEILQEVYRGYGSSCRAAKLAERMINTSKFACEMDNLVIRETSYKDWNDNQYGYIYLGGDNPVKEEKIMLN